MNLLVGPFRSSLTTFTLKLSKCQLFYRMYSQSILLSPLIFIKDIFHARTHTYFFPIQGWRRRGARGGHSPLSEHASLLPEGEKLFFPKIFGIHSTRETLF